MNPSSLQQRIEKFTSEINVYPVSCEHLSNGRSDLEWLDAVLIGGAKIVQLRDKQSTDLELYEKALAFREKTTQAGALFIVNNRVDIALAAKADGIHIGNSDLPAQEARKLAPEMIIGISANTKEQAATAKERGASYFNIGPIYPTKTKKGLSSFLGPEEIPQFAALSPLPYTVMGGIKRKHIEELTANGARRIAVVTALTKAEDICSETQQWIREIHSHLQCQPR